MASKKSTMDRLFSEEASLVRLIGIAQGNGQVHLVSEYREELEYVRALIKTATQAKARL